MLEFIYGVVELENHKRGVYLHYGLHRDLEEAKENSILSATRYMSEYPDSYPEVETLCRKKKEIEERIDKENAKHNGWGGGFPHFIEAYRIRRL